MSPTIHVDNVSKTYQLGESQSNMLRDVVMGTLRKCVGRGEPAKREIKRALDGVSLDIKQGEVVGLIGRNGAGKSTLLKILSRITWPTSGSVEVKGRVASLLEVGTGFHDELTGRENVYMNGSILGMKKREIDAAMDEIVEFADIGSFLDTPIKRYSSGMRMRLGFSVAAHLKTDVLFVDEVLAVGDAAFQKKCLGAMRDLSVGGRTVVFVSHNMAAVENLCQRTVWIADGKVQQDGPSHDVLRSYLTSFGASDRQSLDLTRARERRGTGAVKFTQMEFLDKEGEQKPVVHSGDALTLRMHYECFRDIPNLHFGVRIYSNLGALITDAHTWSTNQAIEMASKGHGTIDVNIDFLNLMPGTYYLSVWASSFDEWHDVLDNVAHLEVEPSDYYGTGRGVESRFGLIFLPFKWQVRNNGLPAPSTLGAALGTQGAEAMLTQNV